MMTANHAQAMSSRVLCQVGLVVKDIEKSARAYADLFGLDVPAWTLTDPEDTAHTRYQGQPSPARAKLAFFSLGSVSLELIEPVGGPSTWQEFLTTRGEGVHHIAFEIEDMAGEVRMLAEKGMPLVQRGDYSGGQYAYIDSAAQLAVILELLQNDR